MVSVLPIISCSQKNDNFINYDGSKESFNKIAKNVKYNDFKTDLSLKINDVKSKDIIWLYEKEYEKLNLHMEIIILRKGDLDITGSGEIKKNAVEFSFKLKDVKKNWVYDATNNKKFWLWSYLQ